MRKTIIAMGLLTAVIGLMMIFAPEAVVKTAVIILGVAGIVNGAYNIIYVRKAIDDKNFSRIIIIRGILGIITGLIAVILPLALAGAVWTEGVAPETGLFGLLYGISVGFGFRGWCFRILPDNQALLPFLRMADNGIGIGL